MLSETLWTHGDREDALENDIILHGNVLFDAGKLAVKAVMTIEQRVELAAVFMLDAGNRTFHELKIGL